MKIIFGIGNPGVEYQNTRHNLGFRLIDKLTQEFSIKTWKSHCRAMVAETQIVHEPVLLVKPLTYVNLCGESAKMICQRYSLLPETMLIAVDDVALPLGQIRLRRSGSSGSHRGLASLIQCLDTQVFSRLRLGIDNQFGGDLASFVLSRFHREEEPIVAEMLQLADEAVITWLKQGIDVAMNKYNSLNYHHL